MISGSDSPETPVMNRIRLVREAVDGVLLRMEDDNERRNAYVHLYGVAQSCALLALRRGQNLELAVIAGMLHDIYTYAMMDPVDHAHKSATMADKMLAQLGVVSEDEAAIVCDAIRNHSDKGNTHSAFDEVLKDADSFQFWLYDPMTEPLDQSRRERCTRVLAELGVKPITSWRSMS